MLSQRSTGVAVVDAQEDFLRASAIANETPAPDITGLPIRRNVALLSAAVAANASTLQLTSAVASISLARLLDVEGLLGLGPALVLAAGPLAAVPAGRAMDRRGRIAVLAPGVAGLVIGAMALVAAPALWILGAGTARRRLVARTTDHPGMTPCAHTHSSCSAARPRHATRNPCRGARASGGGVATTSARRAEHD
jgi:MFS family permease